MSLTFQPYGLKFVEYKGGKNRVSTSQYTISSGYNASIGQGDPVQIGINGHIQAYAPLAATAPAMVAAAQNIVGVAVGFSWVSSTGVAMNNQPYWPAGTTTLNSVPATITVADPTDNIYKIQCGSVSTSLDLTSPATACFKNFNMSNCATTSLPNARTSQSTAYLDTATYAASPNYWLSLKIVGLANTGEPNSWYDPFPEVLVIVNSHAYKSGTNGI